MRHEPCNPNYSNNQLTVGFCFVLFYKIDSIQGMRKVFKRIVGQRKREREVEASHEHRERTGGGGGERRDKEEEGKTKSKKKQELNCFLMRSLQTFIYLNFFFHS